MQSTYRGRKGEEERGDRKREMQPQGEKREAALGCGKCLCPTKRTMRCVCLCVCVCGGECTYICVYASVCVCVGKGHCKKSSS